MTAGKMGINGGWCITDGQVSCGVFFHLIDWFGLENGELIIVTDLHYTLLFFGWLGRRAGNIRYG